MPKSERNKNNVTHSKIIKLFAWWGHCLFSSIDCVEEDNEALKTERRKTMRGDAHDPWNRFINLATKKELQLVVFVVERYCLAFAAVKEHAALCSRSPCHVPSSASWDHQHDTHPSSSRSTPFQNKGYDTPHQLPRFASFDKRYSIITVYCHIFTLFSMNVRRRCIQIS